MLALHFLAALACAGTNTTPAIEPIPSVQAWIKEVVALGPTAKQEDLSRAVDDFRQNHADTREIIQQLLYFELNAKKIYGDERISEEEINGKALLAHVLIAFCLDWDKKKGAPSPSSSKMLIDALLPYLGTRNTTFKNTLHQTLMWVDQMHGSKKDFSHYESYLRCSTNAPTESLVRYMYDRDSRAAVMSMCRVYGDKTAEPELADKLKADPKAALQSLVDRPEWWVRLYVAETMKKQAQLRDPTILKKLEKDDNPLVRETVAEITSGE